MACPDIPLCLGQWIPPLENGLIATHFAHRLLGLVTALAVIALTGYVLRKVSAPGVRRLALGALLVVVAQVALGFASVYWRLAVAPVSLHTLAAAALFAVSVAIASSGWRTAAAFGNPARDVLVGSDG
jgi:cytochrome c oxidase assembly protein subunit 15